MAFSGIVSIRSLLVFHSNRAKLYLRSVNSYKRFLGFLGVVQEKLLEALQGEIVLQIVWNSDPNEPNDNPPLIKTLSCFNLIGESCLTKQILL